MYVLPPFLEAAQAKGGCKKTSQWLSWRKRGSGVSTLVVSRH